MATQPFYSPKFRALDSDGDPLSGGLLYTYAAGTSTPQATYTTRAGDVANANPVVLDADGEADVWTTPGVDYKFELRNSAGVVQWTVDNVPSPAILNTLADGSLRLPDGTAEDPSLAFIADTDTGLYRVAANSIGLAVGSSQVQRWTASGSVLPGSLEVGGVDVLGGMSVGAGLTVTGAAAQHAATLSHFTSATGATRQDVARLTNGDLDLSAVAVVASTTPVSERLTPSNIPKAWAHITTTNATPFVPTVNDGFNIASVARVDANTLRVTFAAPFATTAYAATVSADIANYVWVYTKTTTTLDLRVGAGALDSPGQPVQFYLVVFGNQ